MKHFYRNEVFALMLIASSIMCFQLSHAKEESPTSSKENNTTIQTVQIELKNPVTIETLFSTEDSSCFNGMMLESDFFFDNETIHDFYPVNSGSQKDDIKKDYVKNRKAFLMDTKKNVETLKFNSKDVENLLITKFTVNGKKGNINQLKNGLDISRADVEGSQSALFQIISGKSAKETPFSH